MEELENEQIAAARIKSLEKEIGVLKEHFNLYVLLRENDLHFKSVYAMLSLKEKQLDSINAKLMAQNIEALGRETAQHQEWAALQMKVLWGVISAIVGLLVSFLIAYMTHLFH